MRKMKEDEAITDLANERMGNAERTIRSSAKSLESGEKGEAGQQARDAAEQLQRLAKQVGALKAAELAEKLQAAENIARQAAQQQRDAEKGENSGENGQSQQSSQSQGETAKGQKGNESRSEGGQGGDGSGYSRSARSANRQRTQAEDVRTAEDILNEAQKDAGLTDPDLARALEKAAAENSPKEIAAQIDRAAKALSAGQREQAKREIRDSAKRLDALADQIEAARHGFTEPKLEALLAAEKKAAELQKQFREPIGDDEKEDIDKKMGQLRGALAPLRGTDPNLDKEAIALSDAIEGGSSGRVIWRESSRQGYFQLPELYVSSVQRVDRALQVRIQELILKDAMLDQDQPVPEQYRRQVEEYLKTLSEDLR